MLRNLSCMLVVGILVILFFGGIGQAQDPNKFNKKYAILISPDRCYLDKDSSGNWILDKAHYSIDPYFETSFHDYIDNQRTMLINKFGFTDDNIWFLTSGICEDKSKSTGTRYGPPIYDIKPYYDGDATHDMVGNVIDILSKKVTYNDLVYFVYNGHGSGYDPSPSVITRQPPYNNPSPPGNAPCLGRPDDGGKRYPYIMKYYPPDPNPNDEPTGAGQGYFDGHGIGEDKNGVQYDECICTYKSSPFERWWDPTYWKDAFWYDDELNIALDSINCKFMIVILDSCFSGGFQWDLSHHYTIKNRIVLTEAPEDGVGYAGVYLENLRTALCFNPKSKSPNNPDTGFPGVSNHDGIIEIEEAQAYAMRNDTMDEQGAGFLPPRYNPCIWDAGNNNIYDYISL